VYKHWSAQPWHEIKRELSPEGRNITGRAFQSAFRDIKPLGDKARKARGEIVKILSAEEFDGEAFDKAVARMLEVRGDMKALKIKALRDVASQLSVEDRRKMAERMADKVGGGYERRVDRHRRPRMITPEHKPEHRE
jgi:uncharacterized membrane protein